MQEGDEANSSVKKLVVLLDLMFHHFLDSLYKGRCSVAPLESDQFFDVHVLITAISETSHVVASGTNGKQMPSFSIFCDQTPGFFDIDLHLDVHIRMLY